MIREIIPLNLPLVTFAYEFESLKEWLYLQGPLTESDQRFVTSLDNLHCPLAQEILVR